MKVRTLGTICQNPQHGFQKLKAHGKQNSKNYSVLFPYTHSPTLIFICQEDIELVTRKLFCMFLINFK